MPQHESSKRKRTRRRTPGDEVDSNLNERIDRAQRQREERRARLSGGLQKSSGHHRSALPDEAADE